MSRLSLSVFEFESAGVQWMYEVDMDVCASLQLTIMHLADAFIQSDLL